MDSLPHSPGPSDFTPGTPPKPEKNFKLMALGLLGLALLPCFACVGSAGFKEFQVWSFRSTWNPLVQDYLNREDELSQPWDEGKGKGEPAITGKILVIRLSVSTDGIGKKTLSSQVDKELTAALPEALRVDEPGQERMVLYCRYLVNPLVDDNRNLFFSCDAKLVDLKTKQTVFDDSLMERTDKPLGRVSPAKILQALGELPQR